VVYSRYFKSASLLVGIARLLGVPLIIEVNSDTDGERRANARSALFSSLERSEERAIYRGADAIIAVAEAVARATTQVEPQVENKVRIIENGVDTRLYRPMNRKDCAQKHGFEPDRRRVVYAGALQSWQGVEVLVAAIALVVRQCPDVDLLIVGDGPLRPLLERRIASAGLKRQVTIFGYTHEEVTAELIGASDVCVASYTSSAVGECESEKHRVGALMGGSPLKVYMYLACGRPVVASHLCEAGEYVQTNGAGLAVPPEDPNALSEAILQLLADPDLAQEMGARGRLLAEERHDWSIVVDKYLGVIYDAVKAPLAC
jgi:glycosyltransferase involved in cell wall biosynthesis